MTLAPAWDAPWWATRSVALRQPQPPHLFSPDPAKIFSGIVITCARLSPHDVEMLGAAVTSLGGGVRQTLCEDVTHVVATSHEGNKMQALASHPDVQIRAVAPHWIDDSFSLNRLLPEDDYLFDLSDTDSLPVCMRAQWQRPAEPVPTEPYATPSNSDHAVLDGKAVLLSRDIHGGSLESHPQLHSLRDRIERAGGHCLDVLTAGAPLKEVQDAVRRADLVVARYRESDEFACALQHHKTIGTLSWLVRVLSTGHMTSPRDRLLHFPFPHAPVPGFENLTITLTNYTGQARVYLKELIAKMGATFTPEMTPANSVCVALELRGEKVAKAREWNIPLVNHTWLESCFATWTNQNLAQRQFITFPGAVQLRAVVGHIGVAESSLARYRDESEPALSATPPTPAQAVPDEAHDDGIRTEPGPAVADQAVLPPDDVFSDAQRVDETLIMPAPEPAPEADSVSPPHTRKRSAPFSDDDADKRPRPTLPVIATTSVELSEHECHVLDTLSIVRTDNMMEATHLVAKSLTRTEKMLCAIARGLEVVSMSWIRAMVKANAVVPATSYALVDKKKEQHWGIALSDVLARSRLHPGALLQGHHIVLTRHVQPSRDILAHIVEAAGGRASVATAKMDTASWDTKTHVVSCAEDAKVVASLRKDYGKHHPDAPWRVYSPELILAGVLRQDMDWTSTHELEP
ncbi:hypothetical protein MCAP1_001120 [Malassezia caprae]|uniref:BRCT domain-containing protein n=1 Tax=Malassezia caprae TaxID=1381934 RepID=A0AAF0IVM7_9BASI|nr:hypothetical protein MCAP1_001120 [Malassezia caprae]